MPTTHITQWDRLPAEETETVRRILFAGTGADLKRIEIAAGTEAPRHQHPHEQFLLVLSGRATLETADGTFTLSPGTVLRFEPETWHAARFHEDTVLIEVNLKNS